MRALAKLVYGVFYTERTGLGILDRGTARLSSPPILPTNITVVFEVFAVASMCNSRCIPPIPPFLGQLDKDARGM